MTYKKGHADDGRPRKSALLACDCECLLYGGSAHEIDPFGGVSSLGAVLRSLISPFT
jgi:hypothetical protein